MSRFTTMQPLPASIVRRSIAILAIALSACAGYGPGDLKPGQSEADVHTRMGEPTGRYALPDGGSKLEYARGPMGRQTYMIDVDRSGVVRNWEQVLTEANFNTVHVGEAQAEVRTLLGRPAGSRVGWRGVGEVWAYRFETPPLCRLFVIWWVDSRVREASYDSDPLCEDRRRDDK
jgi:hypothetical protein